MTRPEAYEALFQIKYERDIDIEKYLELLLNHKTVPKSVEKFINEHSARTLQDFLMVIAKTKAFFGNICYNYKEDISDYVRAFLSLLIHLRITLDKNPQLRDEIHETFDIQKLADICVTNLLVGGNDHEVIEMANTLKQIFLRDVEMEE